MPPLFDYHRPPGDAKKESSINKLDYGVREQAYTDNMRWATRLNWERLLAGENSFSEQYPDVADL